MTLRTNLGNDFYPLRVGPTFLRTIREQPAFLKCLSVLDPLVASILQDDQRYRKTNQDGGKRESENGHVHWTVSSVALCDEPTNQRVALLARAM